MPKLHYAGAANVTYWGNPLIIISRQAPDVETGRDPLWMIRDVHPL